MFFEIVGENEYFGTLLPAYYRVTCIGDKLMAGWRSYFCRDYQQCFGPVDRIDQFDVNEFEELMFLAEVRSVIHDQEKRPLDEVNHYSRIGRLLKVISSLEASELWKSRINLKRDFYIGIWILISIVIYIYIYIYIQLDGYQWGREDEYDN